MMARTRSAIEAENAIEKLEDGDLRGCLHTLMDFADRGVQNAHTEELFKLEVDRQLATTGDPFVNLPDDDAPRCSHCGSVSTWWRSDGDVACNNCPGIMPMTRCRSCDASVPENRSKCPECGHSREVEA